MHVLRRVPCIERIQAARISKSRDPRDIRNLEIEFPQFVAIFRETGKHSNKRRRIIQWNGNATAPRRYFRGS